METVLRQKDWNPGPLDHEPTVLAARPRYYALAALLLFLTYPDLLQSLQFSTANSPAQVLQVSKNQQ